MEVLDCLYLLINGESDYFWFGHSYCIIEPFTDRSFSLETIPRTLLQYLAYIDVLPSELYNCNFKQFSSKYGIKIRGFCPRIGYRYWKIAGP